MPPLDIVARDLRVRLGMLVVGGVAGPLRLSGRALTAGEREHGIHAGDAETSLMLAFRPDLVRMDEARNFVPTSVAIEQEFTWLRVTQPIGFGWMAQDVSAEGAMGNAARATAEKGEAAADYGADGLRRAAAGRRSGSTSAASAPGPARAGSREGGRPPRAALALSAAAL